MYLCAQVSSPPAIARTGASTRPSVLTRRSNVLRRIAPPSVDAANKAEGRAEHGSLKPSHRLSGCVDSACPAALSQQIEGAERHDMSPLRALLRREPAAKSRAFLGRR